MAAATLTPNALARDLSKSLGRAVTPKMVRTVARSVLSKYDKTKHPAYQSHEYTAADAKTIRAAMSARGTRAKVAAPARKPRAKVAKTTAPATVA